MLRKKRGLGVVEAARHAKISAGFLSAIELSRANPSVATLQRLAATYGTTVLTSMICRNIPIASCAFAIAGPSRRNRA